MRGLSFCAAAAVLTVVSWGAQGTSSQQKKAVQKSAPATNASAVKRQVSSHPAPASARTTTARTTTVRTTTATHSTSSRTGQRRPAPAANAAWRPRQVAPAPERYKEIQEALVTKGYLSPDEANGSWNASSTEALKRFQSEQNLEASGKINSLSLIALGLGPKHDDAVLPPPPAQDFYPQGR